jgi:hypothetical protein
LAAALPWGTRKSELVLGIAAAARWRAAEAIPDWWAIAAGILLPYFVCDELPDLLASCLRNSGENRERKPGEAHLPRLKCALPSNSLLSSGGPGLEQNTMEARQLRQNFEQTLEHAAPFRDSSRTSSREDDPSGAVRLLLRRGA